MSFITTEWSLFWIVACLIFGMLMAFLLYRKKVFRSTSSLRIFLFLLRFLTILILSFFLLKPYINQLNVFKEQAIVLLGIDNSTSLISHSDSTKFKQEFSDQINNLREQLGQDFRIESYLLGQNNRLSDSIDFKDKKTDLSSFFTEISDLYAGRNVVATILATDGIYNSGTNPLYSNYTIDAPIYSIALGDTSIQKDVELVNVSYNELAYLGNTFPIQASVLGQYFQGKKMRIELWNENTLLDHKEKVFSSDIQLFTFDFKVKASNVGMHNYFIKVDFLDGEYNISNNEQSIFIDVLESKQKILLISEISHPDIAAISAAIETNDNYELDLISTLEFDGDFSPYSMVIAFQTIIKTDLPIFYFLGPKKTINTDWFNYKINSKLNEVKAEYNPFSFFSIDLEWQQWLKKLPPLYSPVLEFEFNSEFQNVFQQNIMGISTNRPIIAFSNINGQRQAVCTAEGWWKWRMYEYQKTKNHKLFDNLFQKSIQFLCVKQDKRPFRLRHPKIIYENTPFLLEADLYDANYELVNTPEVSLKITDEKGLEYSYVLNKNEHNYTLELNQLNTGKYNLLAKTIYGSKEYNSSSQFTIIPLALELKNTRANHQMLFTLSKKYNGKMFFKEQTPQLINQISTIESKSLSYSNTTQNDLIHLKWISILLFVFLFLEWIFRKRNTNI